MTLIPACNVLKELYYNNFANSHYVLFYPIENFFFYNFYFRVI